VNVFGLIALGAGLITGPAWGGGVLMCDGYHCRSTPYFPPPIIYTRPPVISTYRGPPPPPAAVFIPNSHGCTQGVDIYPPGWPRDLPPPEGYRRNPNPCPGPTAYDHAVAQAQARGLPIPPPPGRQQAQAPRPSRPNVEVPPPDEVDQQAEIEGDIMAFCDKNPDQSFCGKLGSYLRKHPDRRPPQ
jgi:hypothetical protein